MTSAAELAARLAQLEQRLASVERTTQLPHASVDAGQLRFTDADGQPVFTIGDQGDGVFALQGMNGGVVVATDLDLPGGTITETDISDDAVSTPKLVANAVTADKIEAGAVTAEKIEAGAITAEKITADAIDGMTINGVTINAGEFFAVDPDGSYVRIYDEQPGDGAVIEMGLPTAAGTDLRPARIRTGVNPRNGRPALEILGPDAEGIGQPSIFMGGLFDTEDGSIEVDAGYLWFRTQVGATWSIDGGDFEIAGYDPVDDVFRIGFQYQAAENKTYIDHLEVRYTLRTIEEAHFDGGATVGENNLPVRGTQTGRTSVTAGSSATAITGITVTFDEPFPGTPIVTTNLDTGVNNARGWISRAYGVTATGFSIVCYGTQTGGFTANVAWTAVAPS